jgi:hypothetical protein
VPAFGQVNCLTSTKLVCEVPTSAAIVANAALGRAAGLTTAQGLAGAINSAIGTQLTQLPIPSASVGLVNLKQEGNPIGVPYNNMGPILGDRPDTVGRHHLFLGFSYQHFNFNAIDGIDLKSFAVGFQANTTINSLNSSAPDQAIVYGTENTSVNFNFDQYVAVATYGLTHTTDVSVAVPFNHVNLSSVTIMPQTYVYDTTIQTWYNNTPPNASTVTYPSSGSSSGVGDTVLSVKQMLGKENLKAVTAVGASVRLPSGDALNYLGSGTYGVNVNGLFEYRSKVSPRFKIGYQWNGASQLVNLSAPPSQHLPGGFQYDAGADYSIFPGLSIAGDVLGSQFVNSQSLQEKTINLAQNAQTPPPTSIVPSASAAAFPILASQPNTYTTANFSAGIKWLLKGHLLFYANVLVPLNNVGLRSDPVPLGGISYIIR